MRRESKKYLFDIQQSCERISKFISGKTFTDYESDDQSTTSVSDISIHSSSPIMAFVKRDLKMVPRDIQAILMNGMPWLFMVIGVFISQIGPMKGKKESTFFSL